LKIFKDLKTPVNAFTLVRVARLIYWDPRRILLAWFKLVGRLMKVGAAFVEVIVIRAGLLLIQQVIVVPEI
jgi:hypothetical protein